MRALAWLRDRRWSIHSTMTGYFVLLFSTHAPGFVWQHQFPERSRDIDKTQSAHRNGTNSPSRTNLAVSNPFFAAIEHRAGHNRSSYCGFAGAPYT
jgi:hypothetical protein